MRVPIDIPNLIGHTIYRPLSDSGTITKSRTYYNVSVIRWHYFLHGIKLMDLKIDAIKYIEEFRTLLRDTTLSPTCYSKNLKAVLIANNWRKTHPRGYIPKIELPYHYTFTSGVFLKPYSLYENYAGCEINLQDLLEFKHPQLDTKYTYSRLRYLGGGLLDTTCQHELFKLLSLWQKKTEKILQVGEAGRKRLILEKTL